MGSHDFCRDFSRFDACGFIKTYFVRVANSSIESTGPEGGPQTETASIEAANSFGVHCSEARRPAERAFRREDAGGRKSARKFIGDLIGDLAPGMFARRRSYRPDCRRSA
jgi:hypothetical protein